MHNKPYETLAFAYFCNTTDAISAFRKSARMYCRNVQKSAFGVEGVELFGSHVLEAL